jgi:hypothetical protein
MQFLNDNIWLIPALFLFVAAWVNFNTPPTNRASTTFALFYFGMIIYYALLVALWLLVVITISKPAAQFGLIGPAPFAAALIVIIASQFKSVGSLDAAARQLCVYLASIPREADQLALELANRAEFKLKSPRIKTHVSSFIINNFGKNALNFSNDGSPSSYFTRAVS